MKKIYVAHPYQGKTENYQAISNICRRLVNFGVMPISPVHAFNFLNDKVPEDRIRALTFCAKLADEVWLFGEWEKSEGCRREIQVAVHELITIRIVEGWDGNRPVFRRCFMVSPRGG